MSKTEEARLGVTLLSKRNLTTIPRKVRRILDISHVDRIAWIIKNGEIKVKKAPKSEQVLKEASVAVGDPQCELSIKPKK